MSWDGKEKRKSDSSVDHDNITRLLVLLEAHVINFSNHRKDFETHVTEDKKNFDMLLRAYWVAVGVMSVIIGILKFMK